MHPADLALAFGWAGSALAVALNVPQAWTSARHRRVAGLSPTARWLAVLQAATWIAYGTAHDSAVQVITNAVTGTLHIAVLAALIALDPAARSRASLLPHTAAALAWTGLVAWAATTGAIPVGALAAACGTAALLPQVARLALARDSDTSGISAATQRLAIACSAAWAAHGLLLDQPAVWAPSLLGAAAAMATLALLNRPAPGQDLPVRIPQPQGPARDALALAA